MEVCYFYLISEFLALKCLTVIMALIGPTIMVGVS